MKNKRNIIITIISCVAVCGLSFGITYAYLISQDTLVNTFIVGENTIEVIEEYNPPDKLTPGTSFTKEPSVKNTGNLPCFVRIRADFSDSRAEEFCEIDINKKNWDYNSDDGYYYYKKILSAGEETQPLFTKVTLKTQKADGTDYTDADMLDFDILIYAESVQHTEHQSECAESVQHTEHQSECADDEYLTVWSDYTRK